MGRCFLFFLCSTCFFCLEHNIIRFWANIFLVFFCVETIQNQNLLTTVRCSSRERNLVCCWTASRRMVNGKPSWPCVTSSGSCTRTRRLNAILKRAYNDHLGQGGGGCRIP